VNCLVLGLDTPRLTVVDPQFDAREAALRQRVPELDATVGFNGIAAGFGCGFAPPAPLTEGHDPLTHIYLCLDSDHRTLLAVGALMPWLRLSGEVGVPCFARLRDPAVLAGEDHVRAFGSPASVLGESPYARSDFDDVAASIHAGYRVSLDDQRKLAQAADTAKRWDSQTADTQRSNRAAAAHVLAKLASAQVPSELWLGAGRSFPELQHAPNFTANLEGLARLEHDRWNAERRWAGWRRLDDPRYPSDDVRKDLARRLHPHLRPFDALPEKIQKFDRDAIKQMDEIVVAPKRTP
jgi:hypothetical protein